MKHLLTMVLLFATASLAAQPVDRATALQKAVQFMNEKGRTLHKEQTLHRAKPDGVQPYYVFNADGGQGFVIVSGDDRLPAVLGYSTHGALTSDRMPQNLRSVLQGYADEVAYVQRHNVQRRAVTTVGNAITPAMKCKWDQSYPYNQQCPSIKLYQDEACTKPYTYNTQLAPGGIAKPVVGCIATAMAQVLYHLKDHPMALQADIAPHDSVWPGTDRWDKNNPVCIWQKFEDEGFKAGTTFDWNDIIPVYAEYDGDGGVRYLGTETQRAAVAKLMHVMAAACEMNYGLPTAEGSSALFFTAYQVPYRYLGYNNIVVYSQELYPYQDWIQHLYNEVSASGAVFFGGQSGSGGHGFVIDGYDKEDLFSVNWGWGGECDGYYRINSLQPTSNNTGEPFIPDGFSRSQAFIGGFYAGAPAVSPEPYCLYFHAAPAMVTVNGDEITIPLLYKVANNIYTTPFKAHLSLFVYDPNGQEVDRVAITEDGIPCNFSLDDYWYSDNADYQFSRQKVGNDFTMVIKYRIDGNDEWLTVPGNNRLRVSIDATDKVSLSIADVFTLSVVSSTAKASYTTAEDIDFTVRMKVTDGRLHEPLAMAVAPYVEYGGKKVVNYKAEVIGSSEVYYAEKDETFDIPLRLKAGDLEPGVYYVYITREYTPVVTNLFTLVVEDVGTSIRQVSVVDAAQDGQHYDLSGRPVDSQYHGVVISRGHKYVNK